MDWSIAWTDRLAENEDLVRRTGVPQEPPTRKKMIMTLKAGDKLMSLTDVSEMLGIPVHTLYRWRYRGYGPVGYRVGRHVRYRREAVEAWLEQQADQRS
jgi:excisionase family DNA binding protein